MRFEDEILAISLIETLAQIPKVINFLLATVVEMDVLLDKSCATEDVGDRNTVVALMQEKYLQMYLQTQASHMRFKRFLYLKHRRQSVLISRSCTDNIYEIVCSRKQDLRKMTTKHIIVIETVT